MYTAATDTERAARTVITTLTQLGVSPPPPVAEAVEAEKADTSGLRALTAKADRLDELARARARGQSIKTTEALDVLLGAALKTNPTQHEAIVSGAAHRVHAAVVEHVEDILDALRPVFDEAAATITAARAVLGDVELTDLAAVTGVGGDAAEHWRRATAAEKTLQQIKQMILHLRGARAYPGSNDPRDQFLALVDVDLDGYKQLDRGMGMWTASATGRLSLATPSEYTARTTRVAEAWALDPKNPATRIGPGAGQYPTDRAPQQIGGPL